MTVLIGDETTIPRAAIEWACGNHTGISSMTIFRVLSGARALGGRECHPWDPSDFGRCYGLLQAVPEWRARIDEMAALSPQWARLVERWEELDALYVDESRRPDRMAPQLFKAIQECVRP